MASKKLISDQTKQLMQKGLYLIFGCFSGLGAIFLGWKVHFNI